MHYELLLRNPYKLFLLNSGMKLGLILEPVKNGVGLRVKEIKAGGKSFLFYFVLLHQVLKKKIVIILPYFSRCFDHF